jgi:hypothetical protein
MKYAVVTGSGDVICSYIQSFIKTGSGIKKFDAGGDTPDTQTAGNHISLLLFFENKAKFEIRFL